ncbi:matrix extracellular phosphoglycoprotein [Dromiciops gliroides]|uniref:matrix extracellular phosphoglycoprotein n=1 Tax=Dromiciops gliroides TaxID=33562 RepID=UPI001CC4DEFE|nr:matrix extracellular phosphoglycoprotein [Dromiciops gliroides]
MQVILWSLCFLNLVRAAPQKEGNKDHVPVHHFDKGNKQEISPNANVIQESNKSQDVSSSKQILIKDQDTASSKTFHSDFEDTIYTGFTGNAKADYGESVSKNRPEPEAHGIILINKNVQQGRKHASASRLWAVEEDKEDNKIGNSIDHKLEGTKYLEAHGKGDENIANNQRGNQKQNIPRDQRTISHAQYSTDYSKLSPKHIKFPYDFDGSGQGKEDNDFSPSSQEMIVPDTETTDDYTNVPDPDKANAINSNSKFLIGKEANNEVPEKEEYDLNSKGGNSTGDVRSDVSKTSRKEKNIIDKQILKGNNVIRGSSNYRELPGKEGDGIDANTGDAYQGIVGIRHSQGSLKKQSIIGQHARKGSNDIIEGKGISKYGKDNTKAGEGSSKREQKTKNDKDKNLSEGKSQGLLIPSPSHTYPLKGENEIKKEINLHYGYNKERSITKIPSDIRKNHYAAHRKVSSTKSHHVYGRKRVWHPIKAHSSKKFKPPKRNDSSDSSDSDSSDSDSDESTEYFQSGSGN